MAGKFLEDKFLEDDIQISEGFLQGSLDLVFEHAGRYYFADWKTNVLENYAPAHLEEIMREYDLQARIYSCVLVRYLRQSLPDFAYEKHFGGYFYFFLRGLKDGGGIYFARPDEARVEEIFGGKHGT